MSTYGNLLLDMASTFLTIYIGSKLQKEMFQSTLKKVMKAPVNLYFDITPMEKVIGYFTGDIDRCDRHFWGCLEWASHTIVGFTTKIIAATYFSPILGVIIAFNSGVVYFYSQYTKLAKEDIRRI